jgi:hypothetical protein
MGLSGGGVLHAGVPLFWKQIGARLGLSGFRSGVNKEWQSITILRFALASRNERPKYTLSK